MQWNGILKRWTRTAVVAGAAITATAAFAPAAHAETSTVYITALPDSGANVMAFSDRPATSLKVLRGSATVAQAASDPELLGAFTLSVGRLELGDRVVMFENDTLIAETSWTGNPTVDRGVCAGKTTFGGARAPGAAVILGGVFASSQTEEDPTPGTIVEDSGQHVTVTMRSPLVAGQVAAIATMLSLPQANGDTLELLSLHGAVVPATCDRVSPPDATPTPTPTPGPDGEAPAFTDAQLHGAIKSALRAPQSKLRSHALKRRTRLALPFAFPEAGTTRLELIARGKVVATGTRKRTAGGRANVTLKLSAAARRARKLTLRATFTPSRAGAGPQRASIGVTLRR
jgi:hypothetical protein